MRTRTLLWCGAVGGPLFVVAFLVEGATRPGYDPMRHPVSLLSRGEGGWTQVANFFVTGALLLAFAVGLRRALSPLGRSAWAPLLLGAAAIGLLGAGVFAADPGGGYPPGTPGRVESTTAGALHDLFSVLFFVGLPAAMFVLCRWFARRRSVGWALYSAASGLLFSACFVLSAMGFNQVEGVPDLGGLFQRAALIIGWGWVTLLAVHLLRALPGATRTPAGFPAGVDTGAPGGGGRPASR